MKKALALLALTLFTVTTSYTVLNAQSNPKTKEIKITLNANDGSGLVKTIKTKDQFPLNNLQDPYKKGFEFVGWTLNGELISKLTPISFDVVLKAKWEKAFEVTFQVPEKAILRSHQFETVKEKKSILKPFDPILEGHKFLGWFDGEKKVEFPFTPTKHTTLMAKFVKKYNVVSLNLNGGSGVEDKVLVPYGEKLSKLLEPIKEGLTFDKWQLDGKDYDFKQVVEKDMTLNAVYREGNVLTFVYNDNGKTADKSVNVLPTEITKEPEKPTLENHDLVGWFDEEGKKFEFGKKLTKSTKLTAKWEKSAFTVTYEVASDATFTGEKVVTVKRGQNLVKPKDPTNSNGKFLGWFDKDGKQFNGFDKTTDKDIVLKAKFDIKRDVTFELDGGTATGLEKPQQVQDGEKLTKPKQIPTKEGHMFEAWYLNDAPYNFDTPVSSNITLKAVYSKGVEATAEAVGHQHSSLVLGFGDLEPNSVDKTHDNPYGNITDEKVISSFTEKLEGGKKPKYFKYENKKLEMYFDTENEPKDRDVITVKQGFPVYKHTKDGYLKIGYVNKDLKLTKVNGKFIHVDETVKDKTLEIVYYLGQNSKKQYGVFTDGKNVEVKKEQDKLNITVTYTTANKLNIKIYETQKPFENNKLDKPSETEKLLLSKELNDLEVKTNVDKSKFALVEGYEKAGLIKLDEEKSFLTIFFTTTKKLSNNPRVWHWGLNTNISKYQWGNSPEFSKISEENGKNVYFTNVELEQNTLEEASKTNNLGLMIYDNEGKFTGNILEIKDLESLKQYKKGIINFIFVESNETKKDRDNKDNSGVSAKTTIPE